jgi:coenzyme F420-0:L-glutamate ligase/coenzyme F420-1:gamma-L-glutamate ligase
LGIFERAHRREAYYEAGADVQTMKRPTAGLDIVLSRRSIRSFSKESVPRSKLDRILEAGMKAPSPHNTQPWKFVVLSDRKEREAMAAALREAYLRFLESMKDPEGARKADEAYSRTVSPPLLILLCLESRDVREQTTKERRLGEWVMATQGVAAAAENMLLAAHALGLGGCWRGAPLFCAPAIRRALALRRSWEPQILLEIGFPARGPGRKRLKAKDDVVVYAGAGRKP